MNFPVFVLNLKTYPEATGERAVALAKLVEKILGSRAIICPQATDLWRVSQAVSVPVFAQHVDPDVPGRATGHTTIEAAKAAGATGTLLNHAEHTLAPDVIESTVKRCKQFSLETIVCASDANAQKIVSNFFPSAVAIEPPDLIGTGVSVSKSRPEILEQAVASSNSVPVLCGAGIATGEDVRRALKLGTKGVLLASAVTKAKDPEQVLRGLASGF